MSVGTTPPVVGQGDLGGYIERAPIPIYVWERHDGEFHLADLNPTAGLMLNRVQLETGRVGKEASTWLWGEAMCS